MPSRFWYPFVGMLTLVAWPGADASAQSIPSPYSFIEQRQELGLIVGVTDAGTGRFGYGPKGGLTYGARWGLEVSGPISLEAVTSLIDATRDVINPGRAPGDRKVGEADATMATIDARLKFTLTGDRSWNDLSPFIVLGGGIAFDVSADSEDDLLLPPEDRFDMGTSFFGTLGLGTRWFVSDHFALRLDGTFGLWKIGTPPGFSDPVRGFEGVETSEWVQALGLSVSTLFRW